MNQYLIHTADVQITELDFFIRLLVAAGIGLLIGLEREHSSLQKKEHAFAGIRTFVLLTLTGFVGAALHFLLSPWVMVVIIFAVVALIGISYWITAIRGDIGGTSELAALLAMLLGALTFLGFIEESLMVTVVLLVMLSSKIRLKNVIGQITQEEMYALVRFVVVALLIFPFLPDENYGPYDAINPREIGWVVVLTSGVGFLEYVLMRIFGAHKGTLLTGIIGGLISSTMVTWIFARKSKQTPSMNAVYTSAILAAATIMVFRVFLWVFLFNKSLLGGFLLPILLLFVAAAGGTLFFYYKDNKDEGADVNLPLGKPLELTNALLFGILYVGILLAIHYANDILGEEGILITSGIAGLSDVDAISISISKMSVNTIPALTAWNALLIAALANTMAKFTIALWAGSGALRRNVCLGYGVIFVAGLIGFLLLNH